MPIAMKSPQSAFSDATRAPRKLRCVSAVTPFDTIILFDIVVGLKPQERKTPYPLRPFFISQYDPTSPHYDLLKECPHSYYRLFLPLPRAGNNSPISSYKFSSNPD